VLEFGKSMDYKKKIKSCNFCLKVILKLKNLWSYQEETMEVEEEIRSG